MKRGRVLVAAGVATLAVGLALTVGCSMLSEFKPAIDTPEMRAAGLESHFLETELGRVHFVAAGRPDVEPLPPRVLFVHGSPGTWDAWRLWLEETRLRDRARLLAADRLGFGGSERGDAEPSLARQAAALAAILESESGGAGRPAIVVGHSLGGPIASRLAMDRPDLVAGLVLIAPSIDPSLERHRWYNVAASLRLVQWFLPVDWTTSNRELWPLERELGAMKRGWESIGVPVVVIQGDDDDLVPPGNADFAERMMPSRVEVRRVPGEGHFVLWRRPELVSAAILELLDATASGAADADGGATGLGGD